MSDEKFKEEKLPLEKEIKELGERLGTMDQRIIQHVADINDKFTYAVMARKLFSTADITARRDIAIKLGSRLTIFDRNLRIETPFVFKKIKEMKLEAPKAFIPLPPNENGDIPVHPDEFFSSFPTLLRGLQEIRTYFLAEMNPVYIPDFR